MLSKLARMTGKMMKDGLKLLQNKKFEVMILPDKTRALRQHDRQGVSALYHDTWKRLIASSDADETALEKVQEKLETYGHFDFTDDLTKLVEKRGVSKKNWHEMVDAWVEAGLPQSKASEFKLAAETEEGDSCSEMFEKTTSHEGGLHERKLHYLRIQVLQRTDGLLDILFAVYRSSSK